MNLLGDVTPDSLYSYVDQSLWPWDKRPIFKTNIRNFVSLRKNILLISLSELHQLTKLFKEKSDEYKLDPSYESKSECPIKENCDIFRVLQDYNRINIVVPVGVNHMYYVAVEGKSCKLTPLGLHYWQLVKKNRI